MTTNECAAWLLENDNYLIISHRRPDGDTLGSGAALCSALRRAGKTAFCLNNPQTTETYKPFVEPYTAPEGFSPSKLVTVDVADEQLFPESMTGAKIDLAVDHHPTNTGFCERLCNYPERASCGEVVLEVIEHMLGAPTVQEAELLYIAISTDTGCFQYSNTTADTFRATARLLDIGAGHGKINRIFFRSHSRARIKLEGSIMSELRSYREGQVSVAVITLAMFDESGATEDDCEDLAGIAGRVAGSVVNITIRQLEENKCKVSLRSYPQFDCSAVCARFGGGGHRMASGCTLDSDPEETLERIMQVVNETWPEA